MADSCAVFADDPAAGLADAQCAKLDLITTGQLTPQELQIAQLAADGLANREIGQRLFLSHRTVGFHPHRLFPKLGITTRG